MKQFCLLLFLLVPALVRGSGSNTVFIEHYTVEQQFLDSDGDQVENNRVSEISVWVSSQVYQQLYWRIVHDEEVGVVLGYFLPITFSFDLSSGPDQLRVASVSGMPPIYIYPCSDDLCVASDDQ